MRHFELALHRLYRLLLRLYPADFRRAHSEDMLELLDDLRREARRKRGALGSLAVLGRTFRQLPTSLCGEWRHALARPRRAPAWGRHYLVDALRLVRRSPGFAVAAALTLALGIGANTAIWSVVYGVLFRTLELERPDELVFLWLSDEEEPGRRTGVSPDLLEAWRSSATTLVDVAAWTHDSVTLMRPEGAEEMDNTLLVTENFFEVLGVEPLAGRTFVAADVPLRSRGQAVVLSDGLVRASFGDEGEILGRSLTLDEDPVTVVGVASSRVPVPPGIRMWIPQDFDPEDPAMTQRLIPVARLRPDASPGEAEAELRALLRGFEGTDPDLERFTVTVQPVHDALTGNTRPRLGLAAAAVALVLLIACANLSNLMLARAVARERELATRRALGAGPADLTGHVLTESLCLALLGGAAGCALAVAAHRLILATAPGILPRLDAVRIDAPVLAGAFALSVLAGGLFALPPLVHALTLDPHAHLRDGRSGGGRRIARARSILVVGQIGLAVTLLAGAGLLVRSLLLLRAVDPGFDAAGVVAARIYLDDRSYPDDESESVYFRALMERLSTAPGVEAAGASTGLPMDPITIDFDVGYEIPTEPLAEGERRPQADFRVTTPGYFAALRIPVLHGRPFAASDSATSEPVAVINRTLASQIWPGESPLGRELVVYFAGRHRRKIVGVVEDIRFRGLDSTPRPELYVPHAQAPFSAMTVVMRGRLDAAGLLETLRSEVLAVDPRQPVNSSFTMEQLLDASLSRDRFYATMLGVFSAVAALVAAAGLYGVIAYWVNQSRHEIGIRLALGARRSEVLTLVLARGLRWSAAGLAVGLAGALVLGRSLERALYGVSPTDPLVLGGVASLLALVTVAASYVPARQASRVDPATTLRLD
jgi:putative ABC transport system permease protein